MVYNGCRSFTHNSAKLAYINAERWPGLIQPVLDDHQQSSTYL